MVGAVLGLAATTVLAGEWAGRPAVDSQRVWLASGLIDLWLITELCISVGDLVTGGTDAGFRGGHLAATLIWFGCAAAALMRARTLRGQRRALVLGTGLSVIAAAIAKLFLFDLATLDGVFRVVAFIVAGLVLLSLGVAYAQRLVSDDGADDATPLGPVH
ncbi:DUF2339 domain-containing protein [Gordonia neofelifaecis]|nr:DUF2339 domain-containing protein [Gordonia neofelifaecis]